MDDSDSPAIHIPHVLPGDVPCCHHCGRPGTEETLKRCGGCSTILYCSRECQKAEWKSHKTLCRPRSPSGPSPINIGKILLEWLDIHIDSFKAAVNCTVYLSGGLAHALSEPRGIMCYYKMREEWDGNPAAPVHIVSFDFLHKDEAKPLRDNWDSLMDCCKAWAEREENAHRPAVAGVIPVIFCSQDGVRFLNAIPVFHSRLADDTALDGRTRLALFSVAAFSRICLEKGVVFKEWKPAQGHPGKNIHRAGYYYRRGKKWKWESRGGGLVDSEFGHIWLQMSRVMPMDQAWVIYEKVIRQR
ncbi:hypothetical protein L226DRAFT_102722 [Lentinus tigrinus ALCF2SS1-7]|uniref:MYND-type domain-containing protein n=1 Tax=Lentinus tigrinus ALCF2SS1-6 TaxID=1328759 RepID=A0A5C2S7E8_9APHY|nr:hypothetical protein L227DRAFT_576458 [Lentinus tigrinus ALCF2SS1-6]RPD73563.1 hypothetical protein L226DRAFT_102722 [Lentinus tigrinus ALCF2SS1-7]